MRRPDVVLVELAGHVALAKLGARLADAGELELAVPLQDGRLRRRRLAGGRRQHGGGRGRAEEHVEESHGGVRAGTGEGRWYPPNNESGRAMGSMVYISLPVFVVITERANPWAMGRYTRSAWDRVRASLGAEADQTRGSRNPLIKRFT